MQLQFSNVGQQERLMREVLDSQLHYRQNQKLDIQHGHPSHPLRFPRQLVQTVGPYQVWPVVLPIIILLVWKQLFSVEKKKEVSFCGAYQKGCYNRKQTGKS